MSAIYDEFVGEMAALRAKYAQRPDLERRQLYRLALEREQLVAIAYADTVLRPRLDNLGVPPDVRELIRHALAWLWRNEEMHAVFIRGTLLADHKRLMGSRIGLYQALPGLFRLLVSCANVLDAFHLFLMIQRWNVLDFR